MRSENCGSTPCGHHPRTARAKVITVSLFSVPPPNSSGPAPDVVRSQDPGQRRVLDRAARQRRINRQLEALENDNFQDDPHAGLPQLGKRLPQFDDDADTGEVGGGGREEWARETRLKEGERVCLGQGCKRTSSWGADGPGAPLTLPGTGFCDFEPAALPFLCLSFLSCM